MYVCVVLEKKYFESVFLCPLWCRRICFVAQGEKTLYASFLSSIIVERGKFFLWLQRRERLFVKENMFEKNIFPISLYDPAGFSGKYFSTFAILFEGKVTRSDWCWKKYWVTNANNYSQNDTWFISLIQNALPLHIITHMMRGRVILRAAIVPLLFRQQRHRELRI